MERLNVFYIKMSRLKSYGYKLDIFFPKKHKSEKGKAIINEVKIKKEAKEKSEWRERININLVE